MNTFTGLAGKPPRPTALTAELSERTALKIAEQLKEADLLDHRTVEESAADIARVARQWMDGYELARALETEARWDCNFEMAEIFNDFGGYSHAALMAAQREWVERNGIEPPFPVGTRVIARWGHTDQQGTISAIYEYGPAQYLVAADGETGTARLVVDFEKVRPLDKAEA